MNAMPPTSAADPCFAVWLLQRTGIDAATLGAHTLERAVLERIRVNDLSSADGGAAGVPASAVEAYWQLLQVSPDERQALVEALVVPETWFFREREAFAALAQLASVRLAREPGQPLRLLSAPCSTGEEPYSIAMALLDAGIDAQRFTIDALDISARAIAHAQAAAYGRNSFRGNALAFRERHFSAAANGTWQLHEAPRQAVRFAQTNLFDLSPVEARYDFIFCRNVLIYFDREAQDRAIRLLGAQLAEHGAIFVGPAETGLMMRHAFHSARLPLAFAFQRTRPGEPAPPMPVPPSRAPLRARPAPARPLPAAAPTVPRPAVRPAPLAVRMRHAAEPETAGTAPAPASLDDARRAADAGQFDEAVRLANAFASTQGPSAEVFYLLGLLADARAQQADAAGYYRKALYLDPGHYEALTHLAALLDAQGDNANARQLMRRAQRAAAPAQASRLTDLRGPHGSTRH